MREFEIGRAAHDEDEVAVHHEWKARELHGGDEAAADGEVHAAAHEVEIGRIRRSDRFGVGKKNGESFDCGKKMICLFFWARGS